LHRKIINQAEIVLKNKLVTGITFLIFVSSAFCNAEGMYGGVKYGTLTSDESIMKNAGLVIGRKITDYFSVEGEYTRTVKAADVRHDSSLSINSLGLYGVVQSQDNIYVKAKAGYSKLDFDFDVIKTRYSDSDSGLAYGGGLGVKIGKGAVEIEYTRLPNLNKFLGRPFDIKNDYLSVGYVISF
jgi:hypothetical protein